MRLLPFVSLLVACMGPEPDVIAKTEKESWIDNGFDSELILVQHKDGDEHTVHYNGNDLVTRQFLDALGISLVEVPSGADPLDVVAEARAQPGVVFAEPDLIHSISPIYQERSANSDVFSISVDDPFVQYQWNIDQTQADQLGTDYWGENIVVAVLDTGVFPTGNDGFDHLISGFDFINNDANATDDNGHGTHVAGVIAQSTNNAIGCRSVSPDAVILPVKVLAASGSGSGSAIVSGVDYAVQQEADIINMSLGTNSNSSAIQTAVDAADAAGAIVVAANGNDAEANGVDYPAKYDSVIAVSALDYGENLTYYSNYGPETDFSAPGGEIYTDASKTTFSDANGDGQVDGIYQETYIGGNLGYYFYEGTSQAAPAVSGALAVLMSAGASKSEAIQALTDTAKDLGVSGQDDVFGHGLIQIDDALQNVLNNTGTPVSDLTSGDLIITEIMHDPAVVADYKGEWFEVKNSTSSTVDLSGLVVSGSSGEAFSVSAPTSISAGAYAVFAARNRDYENGGLTSVDVAYSRGGFKLDLGDVIQLEKSDGTILDTVAYAPSYSFPSGSGAALTLGSESVTLNDSGGYWCEATSTYGDGDFGTPGASNDVCNLPLLNATALTDVSSGDLIISEIMHDPDAVLDYRGEWFEIYNATASDINLNGLNVSGFSGESFSVTTDVLISSGDYFVFGARDSTSQNGNLTVDHAYSRNAFKLNLGDLITLQKPDGTTIDSVLYAPSYGFPNGDGSSLSLALLEEDNNDNGIYWCDSSSSYGDGDFGTPGAANDNCGIDFSNTFDLSTLSSGDLIISEVMHDPVAVSDYRGEWFEVYNSTSNTIDIQGLVVTGVGSESFTVSETTFIPGNGYFVFGTRSNTSQNGGVTVDYVYSRSAMKLDRGDIIQLEKADGTVLDDILYHTSLSFPAGVGASMSLSVLNATDNDSGANWCDSNSSLSGGDFGTPGAVNDGCD